MRGRDLNYWVELVFRRRATVVQVAGVVFGLVLFVTLLWPPVYESTAMILVQDNRAQYLISPDLQDNMREQQAALARPITEEDLNSERELLTSFYLIRQAVQDLQAPRQPGGPIRDLVDGFRTALLLPASGYRTLHEIPILTPRDRWALKLANHLNSSVIKRSDIIEVSFSAHDPNWSKEFLSRLINQYLELHANISHDPQAEQFFQRQAELLKNKLRQAEDNLRTFETQTGVSDLPAQQQAIIQRLSQLQLQQSQTSAEFAATKQREATVRSLLARTPERILRETRKVQNAALQNLKPQVMQMKAERADLLSRYQPNSRRIQEMDAKIRAAERILSLENNLEVKEQSTDLNPSWTTLDGELDQTKGNIASLTGSQAQLADQIQTTRAQLNQLVNNGVALNRLAQEVATAKEAYLSYVRKSEEARAAGALNSNKILNVSVVQPPLQPLRPTLPKVWLNLTVGALLALVLGIGAAEWEERFDAKVYSAAEISQSAGIKTVAALGHEA